MRIILTLATALCLVAACKKDKPAPSPSNNTVDSTDSTDSTNVPKHNDPAFIFKGIDSVVTLGIYDSIEIPFTVVYNKDSMQDVTLSLSTLPMRMYGSFTTPSGTTPLASSLKLSTYLFADKSANDTIVITVTYNNGLQEHFKFRFAIDYFRQLPVPTFYNIYKQSPIMYTYEDEKLVWGGPGLQYDTTTGKIYVTGLYLGDWGSGKYISLDDYSNPKNNVIMEGGSALQGYFDFGGFVFIKGTNNTDTSDFTVEALRLYYYLDGTRNDSSFMIFYNVMAPGGSKSFRSEGKLKFN